MKASISPLIEEEIDALVTLVNSAYRGESSKKGWTTEADLLDGIRTDAPAISLLIKTPGSTMLVCKNENNAIEGCVYLQKQYEKLYLGMLTVDPLTQGKGTGKLLLLAAENYAIQNKLSAIFMTVIDVRYELIAWYQRQGYAPTGETKPFPDDPAFGIPRQPLQFAVLEKKISS